MFYVSGAPQPVLRRSVPVSDTFCSTNICTGSQLQLQCALHVHCSTASLLFGLQLSPIFPWKRNAFRIDGLAGSAMASYLQLFAFLYSQYVPSQGSPALMAVLPVLGGCRNHGGALCPQAKHQRIVAHKHHPSPSPAGAMIQTLHTPDHPDVSVCCLALYCAATQCMMHWPHHLE